MRDDEDYEHPPGEFPPGLDLLSEQIDRLASLHQAPEDDPTRTEGIAKLAAPFVGQARQRISRGTLDGDTPFEQIREILAAVEQQAPAMMSAATRLTVGGTVYAAATLTATVTLIAGGTVLADQGSGVDSITVQKAPRPLAILDRLAAAYVYYIVMIWILTAGLGVVVDRFNLPPHAVAELQTDTGTANLALDLTLILLNLLKR